MFNVLSARQQPNTTNPIHPTTKNRTINYKILIKENRIIHKMNKHYIHSSKNCYKIINRNKPYINHETRTRTIISVSINRWRSFQNCSNNKSNHCEANS